MTLTVKGLDYEIKNCNLPSQVKRYNPRGRVPIVLIDDEPALVDSSDIVTALDGRFPDPPLEPDGERPRAQARMLEDWADEVLYFYGIWLRWCEPDNFARLKSKVIHRLPIPFRWFAAPIALREVRARVKGQGVGVKDPSTVRRELSEAFGNLESLLEGRSFLVGDRLSRADIAVAACLDQYRIPELTPETRAETDALPRLSAWLQRVHEVAPNVAEPPPRG